MKTFLGFLTLFVFTFLLADQANAGFRAYNGTTDLKIFDTIQCSTGANCTRAGSKMVITANSVISAGVLKNFSFGWKPNTLTSGTSTADAATTVFLTMVNIGHSAVLTGIKVLNGSTVGTNKYIVALFDSTGKVIANSALAGLTTSGSQVYQTVAFTAPLTVVGPAVYWIGVYMNGSTDTFQSIPAVGEMGGYAGTNTGQTFGTVVAITPPTTFTADKGPIAFTY